MKRLDLLLILLFFAGLSYGMPAETQTAAEKAYVRADRLIGSREFLGECGFGQLQLASGDLSLPMKKLLYDKYVRFGFPLLEEVANFFIPSLGSWLQGDWVGALITDIGLGSSLSLFFVFNDIALKESMHMMGDVIVLDINDGYFWLCMTFGIMAIGFYAANLVFPIVYTINWNNHLTGGLGYNPWVSRPDFMPSYQVTRTDKRFSLNLLSFRF